MRALRRRREIGTRVALGTPLGRLIAQLIAESLLLALIAGGSRLRSPTRPAECSAPNSRHSMDGARWSIIAPSWLGLGIAVVAGVAAGLAPALFAMRTDVITSLRSSSGITPAGNGTRTALLVAQAALCTALLASGGTFLQSLRRATEFDYGFDHERLLQVALWARDANAEAELASAAERLRATRGVVSVGRTFTPLGVAWHVVQGGA